MAFKRFRIAVVLRLVFLSLSIFAAAFLVFHSGFYITAIILFLFVIIQVVSLIRYAETTNRNLNRFLRAVRFSDFSQSFSTRGMGKNFDELGLAFESVMSEFRKLRAEREAQFRYLQTVIHHIGIGLMVYRENGEVVMVNNAAKKLFGLPAVHQLSQLEALSPELVERLRNIRNGETTLTRFNRKDETVQANIFATEFRIGEQDHKLVSIQNIFSELETREIESWQKLIRVLTHEIMNSITPISTLADTMTKMLFTDPQNAASMKTLDEEDKEDLFTALRTINRRTAGLMNFVQAYRRFAFVPKPTLGLQKISQLFSNVENLLRETLREKNVQLSISISPENLELNCDSEQIEQVLLNLLLNSVQAMEGQSEPRIRLDAGIDDQGHLRILVEDNGPGIPDTLLDKIFIPFFTTKPKGSGIGLSISRQIMQMHGGTITIQSGQGKGTSVRLRF